MKFEHMDDCEKKHAAVKLPNAAMVSGIKELLTRGVIDAGGSQEMAAVLFQFDVGRR